MQNRTDVVAASFSEIALSHSSAKHPRATLALVHVTGEIRPIVPGSYESRYACGEVISLTISSRDGDAEVFCDECARREGLEW
jgi:hypothetical protein